MNLKDLKELIDLVKTSELTELEWERSGTRVRICRSAPPPPRSASAESGVAVGRPIYERDTARSSSYMGSVVFEFRQDAELESALSQLIQHAIVGT